MEAIPQQPGLNVSTTSPSKGIFATKIPSTAAFLVAVLLFLLPFAEVRCNGSAIANNTGLGIAMGHEWKEVVSKNLFGRSFESSSPDRKELNQGRDPNKFAIAALVLGAIGLVIAFLNFRGGGKINLFVGLLGAASLIAMLIDLKSKVKSDTSVKSSDLGINMGMKVTVDGTGWFYFAVVLFVVAAIFGRQLHKTKTESEI